MAVPPPPGEVSQAVDSYKLQICFLKKKKHYALTMKICYIK